MTEVSFQVELGAASVQRKTKKALREWVPPSPFTPMPAYDAMDTPELKVCTDKK